jgi:crossover junction endodeoxyribonuclease RusA
MYAKARTVANVRTIVQTLARAERLPCAVSHVTVHLHYRPRDNRRRDTDNLVATLKPICDALAAGTPKHPGYGMVPDDIPRYMAKPEPVIHPAERGRPGSLWLEITWTEED